MPHGDEIWDEEQWEAFLRQSDRRINRYMDLLFTFLADHPPPDASRASERQQWEQKLQHYLREQGFEQDPFLSTPPDDDEPDEDDLFGLDAEADLDPDEIAHRLSFREIPVYQRAFELATEVLEWSNHLPGDVKDSTLVQFCSSITQIPANIAKGHGIGYERDMIGGNIACVKRGLAAANAALDQLRELKAAPYVDAEQYHHFVEQVFEIRNALGVYVQDLRARFNLGID